MFDFLSKAGSAIADGASSVGSALGSGLAHTFTALQDPEVQANLRVFSAAMSDDQDRYQKALNAYDARKTEIARQRREEQMREEDRKWKLEDLKAQYDRQDLVAERDRGYAIEDRDAGYEHDNNKLNTQHQNAMKLAAFNKPAEGPEKPITQVVDGVMYQYMNGEWVQVAGSSKTEAKAEADVAAKQAEVDEKATAMHTRAQDTLDAVRGIGKKDVANVGGYSTVGGLWSSESKSSAQKFNQVLSQQFMQNISQMKGMGSLSNAEGSKVTGAATALVDPETNTIRLGLDEKFVQEQLNIIEKGAINLQRIAEFYSQHGREPNIQERKQLGVGAEELTPRKTKSGVSYTVR